MNKERELEAATKPKWISVEDDKPQETGRYWCYVEEIGCLGFSHYQWNCAFTKTETGGYFTTESGSKVTHWQPLSPPPEVK